MVFPQCENTRSRVLEGWRSGSTDANRALKILEIVEKDYKTDPKRRVLSGWSMGGYGAWSLAAAEPDRWSSLVPLAGGGQVEWAEKLKALPIWAWHGDADGAVNSTRSREMIDAIKAAGGTPRYTPIPGGDHDSWKVAFSDDRLIAWMLNPSGVDPDKLPAPTTKLLPKQVVADPFVAALEMPNAVYARIGNQALEAAAYAAPKTIPANLLSGGIRDIFDSTNVDGYGFQIQFTGISYSSQLKQLRVKAYTKDRINVQIGLENASLNIGATYVTGEDHSATAGPIQIGIGHRRPVWLSVDLQPYVENRRIRLRQVGARFDIPNDNWYVTSPAGVSVSGWGMKREAVSGGLVRGLYGSKNRIESEVLSIVPNLIETLEKKLAEYSETGELAGNFWPIPVYKPRLKFFPQTIAADENGLLLTLGATVAAFDPKNAPKQPKVVDLKAPLPDLSKVTALQIGISPGSLDPISEIFADAKVGNIHVLDIPEDTFSKFADKTLLTEFIPELKRHPNASLDPILTLSSGIRVTDAAAIDKESPPQFELAVSKITIATSLKLDPNSDQLTPFAEYDIELKQKAQVEFLKPTYVHRTFKLTWHGDPEVKVTCRFADGYLAEDKMINSEAITTLLVESWKAWTALSPTVTSRIPDIDFGLTKLRMANAGWNSPHLFASFTVPIMKLSNTSEEVFTYETKGPYSDWGGPYKIEPGKSHEFEIPYPLTYRRSGEIYTLAPGSHSEFRVPTKGGSPRLFQARD